MHDAQNLERAGDAVAGSGESAEGDVTALFATESECFLQHLFAVNNIAIFVTQQDAIGIAVMRNTNVRAAHLHDALDFLRMNTAAAVVDINTVWLVVRHGDVRAKFAQNARCRFVSGAICDVHSHSHFLKRHSTWKTRLGEFDVATERIIDARRASDFAGRWPNGIDLAGKNELLDSVLNLIIQLVTVVPEKFDAVVLIRIMRSRKDDAGVGAQRSRDVSHTGCRQ